MSTLIGAMLDAPLMGVLARWPNRLHAVDMEGVVQGWDRGRFQSACGKRGIRLVGGAYEGQTIAALWPPRLKGLPEGYERCRDCWEATGKMRPRVQWNKAS